MQKRKMVYQIERFVRTYTNGMKKEELFEQDFASGFGRLLFTSEREQEAKAYFEKIEVEAKQLKRGEKFYFYYFNVVIFGKDGEVEDVLGIDYKQDTIKELTSDQYERIVNIAKGFKKSANEMVDEIAYWLTGYDTIDEILNDLENSSKAISAIYRLEATL